MHKVEYMDCVASVLVLHRPLPPLIYVLNCVSDRHVHFAARF